VAVINEAMARRWFRDEDPIGKTVGFFRQTAQIVGIVGNERFGGLGAEVPPALYPPIAQVPMGSVSLLVRTRTEPLALLPTLRREVQALDRDLPLFDVATLGDLLSRSVAGPRFNMLLLGAFGAMALVLAVIGVYGLLNFTVAGRTHEIGVRMALGASTRSVLGMVLGRGLGLIAAGLALGLAAAAALTRLMSRLLFGVSSTDPLTFAAVAAALLAAGLAASYIPARRATKVDPLVALRDE
jgi:putative ABC transport system permease protein